MGDARESVGDRIRIVRIQRGLSRASLASLVGVSEGTIQGWENGTRRVRDVYLGPLARALSTTVSKLSPASKESIIHGTVPMRNVHEALGSALSTSVELLEDILIAMSAVDRSVPPTVAVRLKAIADRATDVPSPPAPDLMTQADAAKSVGVSRQAVHRLVAEGRVKGYPNPERPDHAPMVALSEVRGVMEHHANAEKASPDGDATADRAPEESRPLNPQPADADTTPGGSPLPEQRTPAGPADDEGWPDPPWLSDEYVRTVFRESSAAPTGVPFEELGQEEQDELIRLHTELTREIWREKTAEERAEMIARWQKRRSS